MKRNTKVHERHGAKGRRPALFLNILISVLLLALALSTVVGYKNAHAQEANEWSQFHKDKANQGYLDVELPANAAGVKKTDPILIRDGSQPVVSGNRAFVYAGQDGGTGSIVCFGLPGLNKIWETPIAAPQNWSWSSPAVSGGVVCIGSGSKIHALDATSGKKLWEKDLTTIKAGALVCNSSPTIDGDYLYISDYNNGCYYCLDLTKNGKRVWTFNLDSNSMAPSTAAVDGERVFVGQSAAFGFTPNGKVFCLDKKTGKPVSSWGTSGFFSTVNKNDVTGSVCVSDGFVYLNDFPFGASPESHLYCVNEDTGKEEWKAKVLPTSGTPAVGEGVVVTSGNEWGVGNSTSAFTAGAKNKGGGNLLWKKDGVGGWNMSSAIASGKVAVGIDDSSNPGVTVLETASGKEVWKSNEGKCSPVPTQYGLLSVNSTGGLTIFATEGAPQRDFFFAEGCTHSGYQEYLCIGNFENQQKKINITYMLGDGTTQEQEITVPAESRATVNVNESIGSEKDVAACISGTGDFVAERAMYVNTGDISGGEQVMGASDPGTSFMFAEGCTRQGYTTWLALQNPGDDEANVLLTYFFNEGEPLAENFAVASHSRKTININSRVGEEKDVSVSVTSNKPVVSERVMYFNVEVPIQVSGVHNASGLNTPANAWYFAEGTTRSWSREWLCLLNPNGVGASATVEYVTAEGGGPMSRTYNLKANSRTTINVNLEAGNEKDVSMSVDCNKPVICERPMYFNYPTGIPGEAWSGGHNTIGAKYAAHAWEFAEGTTRTGFKTYLTISNPNNRDALLEITYLIAKDGAFNKKIENMRVPANTRATLKVNDVVGENADVSVKISSGIPIIAERPIYFNNAGFTGGGTSLGFPLN
ncbi:MAG: DUF5719 family protein [Actinomycetota bacterium]|nr:DUF5719 family protein [Actinomycetota bacterium]